jgi:hypothetical protein
MHVWRDSWFSWFSWFSCEGMERWVRMSSEFDGFVFVLLLDALS